MRPLQALRPREWPLCLGVGRGGGFRGSEEERGFLSIRVKAKEDVCECLFVRFVSMCVRVCDSRFVSCVCK